MRSNIFEIVGSTILLGQERLPGIELAGFAALTLGRVRAVEVGNVSVANVTEPAIVLADWFHHKER